MENRFDWCYKGKAMENRIDWWQNFFSDIKACHRKIARQLKKLKQDYHAKKRKLKDTSRRLMKMMEICGEAVKGYGPKDSSPPRIAFESTSHAIVCAIKSLEEKGTEPTARNIRSEAISCHARLAGIPIGYISSYLAYLQKKHIVSQSRGTSSRLIYRLTEGIRLEDLPFRRTSRNIIAPAISSKELELLQNMCDVQSAFQWTTAENVHDHLVQTRGQPMDVKDLKAVISKLRARDLVTYSGRDPSGQSIYKVTAEGKRFLSRKPS